MTNPEPALQPGQAPAAPSPSVPVLVPPSISHAKLQEQIDQWHANAQLYRRRGWLLLGVDGLTVDVAFLAKAAVGDLLLPIVTAAIRLRYDNYDLWPPSLAFIEPWTGQPAIPPVAAPEAGNGRPRNVLLGRPGTGEPFLCMPGIREYHEHPQHTGDAWLLHRGEGAGRLAVVCDRVWRCMARNVVGLSVNLQSVPRWGTQLQIGLAQGDVDASQPPPVALPT